MRDVGQGCLFNPLVFPLFKRHRRISEGSLGGYNVKLQLYDHDDDDIVLIAQEPDGLQKMIDQLENYCLNFDPITNILI